MGNNCNSSDKKDNNENNQELVPVPTTDDGQPIAPEERLTAGSKDWEDVQKDKWRQNHRPSYPACTSARTTFWAGDVENEEKFNRFHRLHHGRQHPAERRPNGYSEGWDGQKVRQENVEAYCRARVVLSQAGITGYWLRRIANRVVRENLNGFSRHYRGAIGAALGFAMLEMYDDVTEAKDSKLSEVASEKYDLNNKKLAEYVFRKYGGED